MKAVIGLVLVAILFASSALASDVVILTNDNFDEVINNNPFVLVEFFAPWCGHCKRLAPEYEIAATNLKDVAVLATVDCTVEENLASRFQIQGFPTLKFFKKGEASEYQGERNAKGIESWISSRVEPSVVTLETKADFDKFNDRVTLARVVFFDGEGDEMKAFTEVAEEASLSEFSFGRVSSAELAEEVGQKQGSVVVFYKHQVPTVYGGEVSVEALKTFLKEKAYPRLETLVLNQAFINRVTAAQRPMVIAFHEDADQLEVVRSFANLAGEEAHFSETPVAAYPELAAQWGASGSKYPTFIVAVWEEGHPNFKAFDEELEFTAESGAQFLRDCVAGTCTPFKRSQPLPVEDTTEGATPENVKTLVYKNFDSIVMDSNKDVLVEFFAPWCGHCKSLAPLYEEIATVFKPIESVVITKFDATQNYFDPKLNVRGFPTIILFPANNKAEPIRYEGNRDFPSITNFVIDNASIKFDASLVSGPASDPEVDYDEKEEL